MTVRNSYATQLDYKAYFTARGNYVATDYTDDVVIEQLLESASRYLDDKTARWYYPRTETRYYDLPSSGLAYTRDFYFDADVLEILSFLNGDGTSISSTLYNLLPANESPKYGLQMKVSSTLTWQLDSNGDWERVLALNAYYGFHNRYVLDAWQSGGTLGAAMTDTTTLAFTASSGHLLRPGQIVRIGNELLIVDTISNTTVTPLKRGDNGSTAATHLNSVPIYIWRPMEEARNAVCEITNTAYNRRFGQSVSNDARVTAGGIVLSPRDIPAMAAEFIQTFQRRVYS